MRCAGLLGLTCLLAAPLPAQVVVEPSGPVSTISAALDQVPPGGVIVVRPGTYREQLRVERPVTIEGVGWPVLDAGGRQAITVTADSVTIRGLLIRNVRPSPAGDPAGIKFIRVRACAAEGNQLEQTYFGIYLAGSRDCRITGNRVTGTGDDEVRNGNAIHLWNDTAVVIERNEVRGHRDGIYLEFNHHARILGNRSARNRRYGLHFMFSDSCEYLENDFDGNGAGVAVMYARAVTMSRNRFTANWGPTAYGVLLKDITDSRIEGNVFTANTVGIHAEGSNRIHASGNQFLSNGWALRLMANAEDNVFERNRFLGNSFDVATNGRTSRSTFRQNYWDRYSGFDLDRDGYGDMPFRPVRLYSLIVQQHSPALILLRSAFIDLLDLAERTLPVLTPEALVDRQPLMQWQP